MAKVWYKNKEKAAVALEELVPAWFVSYDALRMNISRTKQKKYGIKRLQRGGGKATDIIIDYDTLPREIRDSIPDPRKHSHIMEQWYEVDSAAVRVYANLQLESGNYLTKAHQAEYVLNASVLQALKVFWDLHVAELQGKGKKPKGKYTFLAREATLFQHTLQSRFDGVQHTIALSDKRFRQAYDGFFQQWQYEGVQYHCNYASLITARMGNTNALKTTTRLFALLDSMFAHAGSKPSKLAVARKYQGFKEGLVDVVSNETGELYNPEEYPAVDKGTITKWLSSYESRTATLQLRSADRPRTRGLLVTPHDMLLPQYAGSLLSVDDRQPPFEYGAGLRLWLYNALDVGSDAIIATVYGKTKEGMILDFYRQILRNCAGWGLGLPLELEAELALNSSFKDTFLQNGAMFEKVRLEPNNPRGKIIENRNRQFRLGMEKEAEGWKGRPFARDEANQTAPGDGLYDDKKYLSYEHILESSLRYIEQWNNMPHPRHPEMSRFDYFLKNQHPDIKPINWRSILPYLGYMTRSSVNQGRIMLQKGFHFLGDNGQFFFGEELIKMLQKIEGQNVELYWIDAHDGSVLKALVYSGDTYLCEAIPTPKYVRAAAERSDNDEINRQLQSKYVASVEAYLKRRRQEVERITVIDNRPTTISSSFKMPGLAQRTIITETETEQLPQLPPDDDDTTLDHIPDNRSFTKRLADRY